MGNGILLLAVMVGPVVLCAAAVRWASAEWLRGFEVVARFTGRML